MKTKSDRTQVSVNPRLRFVRIDVSPEARDFIAGQQRVTTVALTIRRKSNRRLLTPPPGSASALGTGAEDLPMIRTLGKAFYWQKLLDQGKYGTIRDMARALKLEQGWMAEVIRLTTLAPDIIESILEGRQPSHLNLQTLRGRNAQLPRDWQEQRVLFGYAA
jgi:hypothetical protein